MTLVIVGYRLYLNCGFV